MRSGRRRGQPFGHPGLGEIGGHRVDLSRKAVRHVGLKHIRQGQPRQMGLADPAVGDQPPGELAADHARRTDDQDIMSNPLPAG